MGGIESIVEPPNTLTSGYRRWSVFLFAAAAQSSREEDIFSFDTEKIRRMESIAELKSSTGCTPTTFPFFFFLLLFFTSAFSPLERERNFDCVMRHVPCIRPTQDLIVFSPYALAEKFETTKEDGGKKRREFRGVEKKGDTQKKRSIKRRMAGALVKTGITRAARAGKGNPAKGIICVDI